MSNRHRQRRLPECRRERGLRPSQPSLQREVPRIPNLVGNDKCIRASRVLSAEWVALAKKSGETVMQGIALEVVGSGLRAHAGGSGAARGRLTTGAK